MFFIILDGEDGEAKAVSVTFFCGDVFGASSEDPTARPANAEKDVEETMALREVTRFKTPIPSEAPAFFGERGDSSSFSFPPSAAPPFADTERISLSLRVDDPLFGWAWRYGGIAAFLESSRYTESIGCGRSFVVVPLLSTFL